jgi:hypothetical protein
MSAVRAIPNECPSCGAELPARARFCPSCGTTVAGEDLLPGRPPPAETAPGPMTRVRAEPRWLGLPASVLLLCVGFAALGAAIGLFASGAWPWGLVVLGLAVLLLGAYVELERRGPESPLARRSGLLLADTRSQAASTSEVVRARVGAVVDRHRARAQLDVIESERRPALVELGEAVWTGDASAEARSRAKLAELDGRRAVVEQELESRLGAAGERIRLARLPVDETVMVEPSGPSPPYPPPDEGTPPTPTPVPEPYPPPDEGTPPTPPSPAPPPPERER